MELNNTVTELETPSGETIRLTLNFFLLYNVKKNYPAEYKRYNEILMNGMTDIFDALDILYAAYLCALYEGTKPISYTDFIELFEDDIQLVMTEAGKLMGRKKKRVPRSVPEENEKAERQEDPSAEVQA